MHRSHLSLSSAVLLGTLALTAGCTDPGGADSGAVDTAGDGGDSGTGDSGDTGDTEELVPIDADGDGFPRWDTTTDQAIADCNDDDATVTPDTERFVPAGSFWRGSEDSEDSSPVLEVELGDYCMDLTEVSNGLFVGFLMAMRTQYGDWVDGDGNELYDFDDNDDIYDQRIVEQGDGLTIEAGYEDHPVVEVFYWTAEGYCDWNGKRMPTEAEWEKAARGAEDQRTYPWGEEIDCDHANYLFAGEPGETADPCVGDTLPVGSLPDGASPYGVLDMVGNVAEWVSDWYQADYYDSGQLSDPQGPDDGIGFSDEWEARVTRGGNHATEPWETTVSWRYPEPSWGSSNGVGFRCARGLD